MGVSVRIMYIKGDKIHNNVGRKKQQNKTKKIHIYIKIHVDKQREDDYRLRSPNDKPHSQIMTHPQETKVSMGIGC